jgi:hypothetical protein
MHDVYTAPNNLPVTADILYGALATVIRATMVNPPNCDNCGENLRQVGKFRDVLILNCSTCGQTTTSSRPWNTGAG